MSNDTIVTVRGFAGGDPTTYTNTYNSETGEAYSRQTTLVRIGVTPSYFDRSESGFRDGETAWYSIRTYGTLATNVAASVKKGTPIVARGKLVVRSYRNRNDEDRQENVIIAESVGIDLNNGTATYMKRSNAPLEQIPGEPLPRSAEDAGDGNDEGALEMVSAAEEFGSADPAGVLSDV